MDLGIAGRRAAVGGASQGLGYGTARALAEEGVRVALCGRDAARLEEAAKSLGDGAVAIAADVSTPEGARGFVERAAEALGGVDILIPNCGGPPTGLAREVDIDTLREAVDANFLAMVAMCDAALPAMRVQGWGRIVAITSTSVRAPLANMVYSNSARAGLQSYLKTLAQEVIADGVTVNSVLPGGHATERVKQLVPQLEGFAKSIPAGRLGDPYDFGRVAASLCADWAGFVTGVALPIDGGADRALI